MMMVAQHSAALRRSVVLLSFLHACSWFIFTIAFLVHLYSPLPERDLTGLALAFTVVVGVLFFLTLALFLSAPARILVLLDATHRGAAASFFVTAFYAFTLIVAFLWRASSEHATTSYYNLTLWALFMAAVVSLLSILATVIFSGMLVAPPVAPSRRHIRPPITSTSSRRAAGVRASITTADLLLPPMSGGGGAYEECDEMAAAQPPRTASYLVLPYAQVTRSGHARVLVIFTYLSQAFLFIMGLLAVLESQRLHVITQLWTYTLFYGLLGGGLLVVQIIALLGYTRRFPELTFRHTLPLNLNLVTAVTVWLYSLVVLASWLSSYAPPCCTGDVHASPRQEPAWTLYNNAVTLVGALSVLTLATFVPAATAHLYPERRELYTIALGRR